MTHSAAHRVLVRRRAEQTTLLARAQRFADGLDAALEVRAVVAFGSVARGDFHDASDVDVLVVAERLPTGALERNAVLGIPPSRVEFVAWTPQEWLSEHARGNPIARESCTRGVVLRGALAC